MGIALGVLLGLGVRWEEGDNLKGEEGRKALNRIRLRAKKGSWDASAMKTLGFPTLLIFPTQSLAA